MKAHLLLLKRLKACSKVAFQDERAYSLFACRCVRETPLADGRTVWDLLTDPRSRQAVEVAERFARSEATKEELSKARRAAYAACDAADAYAAYAAYADAYAAANAAANAAAYAACDAYDAAAYAAAYAAYAYAAANADAYAAANADAYDAARKAQARILRECVPFGELQALLP